MSSLLAFLTDKLAAAFLAEGLDSAYGRVQISDRPDLAQYQCNGALGAAKAAGKPPRIIAEAIVARLQDDADIASLSLAGPGFINIVLTDACLLRFVTTLRTDVRDGTPVLNGGSETILLDYGGPNVAKPMHVGHLRTAIIGDTLRRMLVVAGYNALGDIHLGDWGTQMGMIISELRRQHPEWVYFDADITGPYPAQSPVTLADLEATYPTASAACKADPDRMAEAHAATFDLQNKRPGYYALWQHFMDVSKQAMHANFKALNVQFDIWKGESDVHDIIAPMVADLQAKKLAVADDGAVVIPVVTDADTKEIPPLILYKRDGAVMYGTTDLATIVDRVQEYDPARIIYIVDLRQSLHFEQVFRAARMAGMVREDMQLIHAGNGTMNGTDGKPFKTRAGGVMKLEDLIGMAQDKAQERIAAAHIAEGLSADERADIARQVAVAAIKFADLQNTRSADYVFDLDRMTQFEGKTGPYLLYQTVRMRSLLEKAQNGGAGLPVTSITDTTERDVILALLSWPDVFISATRTYMPHIICDYVYLLAQRFSAFYAACHIMGEQDDTLRASRLGLVQLVHRRMTHIFDLLGIECPQRM
ncbi:MAG: arginine--tRNA ligase [Pseudomonadota bacterium]